MASRCRRGPRTTGVLASTCDRDRVGSGGVGRPRTHRAVVDPWVSRRCRAGARSACVGRASRQAHLAPPPHRRAVRAHDHHRARRVDSRSQHRDPVGPSLLRILRSASTEHRRRISCSPRRPPSVLASRSLWTTPPTTPRYLQTSAGSAVAVPVAVYLLSVWFLHDRPEYGKLRVAGPIVAAIVLLTPFTGHAVLLMGALLTGVALKIGHRPPGRAN